MPAGESIVHGVCEPAFAELEQVFVDGFEKHRELGASLCVWHKGRPVVDLWGGHVDAQRVKPWQENTLTTIFSTTKGMVALCFLILADRGKFDYDQAVVQYWREFAAEGKHEMTIRELLNHRGGLTSVDAPLSLDALEHRPENVAQVLAAQKPRWRPGSDQGYHAVTFGLYAAELFRRIAGESLGRFLAREICAPLGADLHLGLAAEHSGRVSPIYPAGVREVMGYMLPRLLFGRGRDGRVYRQVVMGRETGKAFGNPAALGPRGVANFNTPRVQGMELPWANGMSNARGIARVYAALAEGGEIDGVRLVSESSLEAIAVAQSWSDRDRVLRKGLGWSQGFIKEELNMFSPNPSSFGHPGAGGALGWCDPDARLAIGYVPNRMAPNVRSPRARALAAAAYRCVTTRQ